MPYHEAAAPIKVRSAQWPKWGETTLAVKQLEFFFGAVCKIYHLKCAALAKLNSHHRRPACCRSIAISNCTSRPASGTMPAEN